MDEHRTLSGERRRKNRGTVRGCHAATVQLGHKLTPTDVADGFGKGVVLDHVLDLQALDADRLVFTNDASREFVLIIPSPISNLGMNTGNFFANLGSVTARLLFLGKPTLCLRQLLLIHLPAQAGSPLVRSL